jgi:hypothetical protein
MGERRSGAGQKWKEIHLQKHLAANFGTSSRDYCRLVAKEHEKLGIIEQRNGTSPAEGIEHKKTRPHRKFMTEIAFTIQEKKGKRNINNKGTKFVLSLSQVMGKMQSYQKKKGASRGKD